MSKLIGKCAWLIQGILQNRFECVILMFGFQGKCIVNSISLKSGEQDFIAKANIIKVHHQNYAKLKMFGSRLIGTFLQRLR